MKRISFLISVFQALICIVDAISPPVDAIRLINLDNSNWAGVVRIGETKKAEDIQKFVMLLDTGSSSSDIWVPCVYCYTPGCVNHRRYDPSKSDSFKVDKKEFRISYGGGGHVEGITLTDTFKIGNLVVKSQVFAVVFSETLPHAYVSGSFDGIFGLGYPKKRDDLSIMDRMPVQHKQFCFILHKKGERNDVHGREIGGELQFGGCTVQPTMYITLNERRHWEFSFEKIVVGKDDRSQSFDCQSGRSNCQALMDSGTCMTIGPQSEIQSLNGLIGATKGSSITYHIDCNKVRNLPIILFVIQGKHVQLTSHDYIMRSGNVCWTIFKSFEKMPVRPIQWVFGNSFMRTRTVLFDLHNHRIGIGPKANASQTLY